MSTWPTDAEREDFNTFETFVDVDDCLTTRILTTEEIIQQVAKHVARREREAAARALRAAANRWDDLQTTANDHYSRRDAALWLTNEADRIEKGES